MFIRKGQQLCFQSEKGSKLAFVRAGTDRHSVDDASVLRTYLREQDGTERLKDASTEKACQGFEELLTA